MGISACLSPPKLRKTTRALIGDVIMCGAEIDQLVSVALFHLSKIPIGNGFVLFDRTPISTKLKKLLYFVELANDVDFAEDVESSTRLFDHFVRARNTLAHGVLCEVTAEEVRFSVASDYSSLDGFFVGRISHFSDEALRNTLNEGQQIAKDIRRLFSAALLHELSSSTTLTKKPKTPKENRKAHPAKPPRQPPPSQAG